MVSDDPQCDENCSADSKEIKEMKDFFTGSEFWFEKVAYYQELLLKATDRIHDLELKITQDEIIRNSNERIREESESSHQVEKSEGRESAADVERRLMRQIDSMQTEFLEQLEELERELSQKDLQIAQLKAMQHDENLPRRDSRVEEAPPLPLPLLHQVSQRTESEPCHTPLESGTPVVRRIVPKKPPIPRRASPKISSRPPLQPPSSIPEQTAISRASDPSLRPSFRHSVSFPSNPAGQEWENYEGGVLEGGARWENSSSTLEPYSCHQSAEDQPCGLLSARSSSPAPLKFAPKRKSAAQKRQEALEVARSVRASSASQGQVPPPLFRPATPPRPQYFHNSKPYAALAESPKPPASFLPPTSFFPSERREAYPTQEPPRTGFSFDPSSSSVQRARWEGGTPRGGGKGEGLRFTSLGHSSSMHPSPFKPTQPTFMRSSTYGGEEA